MSDLLTSFIPSSGYENFRNPPEFWSIPNNLSNSNGDPGFEQQTFLGASIKSFSINAGFGDSASTLSVELVNDEFNKSDTYRLGIGDDIYHNGQYDRFAPPPVGSPVFFKFGKTKSTITDAYTNLYNQIYNRNHPSTSASGMFHLCFGGILQSYVQNRGTGGDPLYSVQVVDPREILSNTVLILRNYAGTIFSNKNIFNLHGFLEFNPSEALVNDLGSYYQGSGILKKIIRADGSYYYTGQDTYYQDQSLNSLIDLTMPNYNYSFLPKYPEVFPITGTGFSRSGPQGVPYYRIRQALRALLQIDGDLPAEYINAGFGGYINFRGFNYIVDLSGLPAEIPDLYYLDFDQINLLDFCLELCEVTSRELFVSLLPIINHPVSARFFNHNEQTGRSDNKKLIAGIIRIDTISKQIQPQYGSIKRYIDFLTNNGLQVENQDVGFELSNVTTDKFIVGAQEVDMYFFSGNSDRANIKCKNGDNSYIVDQWKLDEIYTQQIIPYYGMIDRAVTIPKGFGAYQQILLDSSALQAFGVGDYYVTTEMELRAASISYERWVDFLSQYNDKYMESTEENDFIEGAAIKAGIGMPKNGPQIVSISNNYAVTVPRCVWPGNTVYGQDGLPVDVSYPPYGYPLYYKRAERLGINSVGLVNAAGRLNQLITNLASVYGDVNDQNFQTYIQSALQDLENIQREGCNGLSEEDTYKKTLLQAIAGGADIGIKSRLDSLIPAQRIISKLSRKTKENSLRVYNFLKKIADECLGTKFLVKVPKYVNPFYSKQITIKDGDLNKMEYISGPFGFKPRAINAVPGYEYGAGFYNIVNNVRLTSPIPYGGGQMMNSFLNNINSPLRIRQTLNGGLEINFNPITELYESNYIPEPQGGYVEFDLMANLTTQNQSLAISQGLLPIDLSNLIKDNGRLGAYVRFNNSQDLGFDNLNSNDFTQQSIAGGFFIPDVVSTLDNLDSNSTQFSFPDIANPVTRPPSIAFVKCDLDDKLYMPPKSNYYNIYVHAVQVIDKGQFPARPLKRKNPNTCVCEDLLDFYTPNFVPDPTAVSNDPVTIRDFNKDPLTGRYKTSLKDLDTTNVYALITLPSKIVPLKDKRFQDGYLSNINADTFKHILTMDVVKIPEFSSPAFLSRPPTNLIQQNKSSLSPAAINAALNARSEALKGIQFGVPARIQASAPSPVYPDLVVLPLRSTERCYGPWVSNQLDVQAQVYNNIAGRVEFIKDENLAPWNYNGYDLMNSAGVLQARFSNSLLLQSERGGFVIPSAPSGIYLGRYLQNTGPLLTNINIDISDGGIRTTYKFDLYTTSFGKLAKQKQEQIANMSRERQKLKDERNALVRKGFAKHQTLNIKEQINQGIHYINNRVDNAKNNNGPMTSFFMNTVPQTSSYNNPNSSSYGDSPTTTKYTETHNISTIGSPEDLSETAALMDPDRLVTSYNRAAASDIGDIFKPVDNSPAPNPYLSPKSTPMSQNTYYS